jgi:metallo-beta-lactamase family protein
MCEGGRIQYHLRDNLPRAESSVVIIGFQVQGTLGRRLVDGAQRVRIFGDEIEVRAAVHTIGGLSAHADQSGLLGWLRGFRRTPQQTFVVHGEHETARTFCQVIEQQLGWHTELPGPGQIVEM